MTFDPLRRLTLGAMAATLVPVSALADEAPEYVVGDVVLGAADAPLTVVEYASLTCPHCASFHQNTWPEIKAKYVDTGKVKFIMREVYFDKFGLWAAMTARCGGERGYYAMLDTFLNTQRTWTRAGDDNAIGAAIQQIGRRAGLSSERLSACLSDREYAKTLVDSYQTNAEADEIRSTPSFVIGGELHSGDMTIEQFSELLDKALESS